jgi:hypothetical protein
VSIESCRVLEFPTRVDARGKLSFVEGERHVPFVVRRVFYLYDLAAGEARGGHAHKQLEQVFVPLAGCFSVTLDDGAAKRAHRLDSPSKGLYVAPMTWAVLENFSAGAVCLVLASERYDESDYHRDYDAFLRAIRSSR